MKKFMFLAVLGLLSGCGGENNGSTQKKIIACKKPMLTNRPQTIKSK